MVNALSSLASRVFSSKPIGAAISAAVSTGASMLFKQKESSVSKESVLAAIGIVMGTAVGTLANMLLDGIKSKNQKPQGTPPHSQSIGDTQGAHIKIQQMMDKKTLR